jgi:hypothetical protein
MPRDSFQQELDNLVAGMLDLGRQVEASLDFSETELPVYGVLGNPYPQLSIKLPTELDFHTL